MKFTEMLEKFPCCTWQQEDEETGRLSQIYDYSAGPSCVATFEIEIEPDGEFIDDTIRYTIIFEGKLRIGLFEDKLPEGIIPLVEAIAPRVNLDLENL
jgi:hypothetical protein